jgi:hypothetical protein
VSVEERERLAARASRRPDRVGEASPSGERPKWRGTVRHPVALLAAGWALLLFAWAMSNPPFAAPDEPAHYLRAVAVGEGSLGPTAAVTVPPGLWGSWRSAGGTTCNVGKRRVPADCIEQVTTSTSPLDVETAAGNYPPPAYVLPGLALRLADDPLTATRVARLAGAALTLAFLVLAAALLFAAAEPLLSLVGLVAAVTPMVVFVGSAVSNSGLEIAAGLAFLAALLRLTRGEGRPRWVWASAVAAGLALASARTTGSLWIALDVLLAAGLVWAGRADAPAVSARRRDVRRPLAALAAVVVGGVVLNRAWELAYGSTLTRRGAVDYSDIGGRLVHGVQQLRRILDEQIGVFGWLDTPLPHVAYPAGQALLAALVAVAFLAAAPRERLVLGGTLAAFLGVTALLSASLMAATETDVQARHVLAFAVAVPLLAAELVFRNRAKLALADPRPLAFAVVGVTVVLHAAAWWTSAYRQSVGTNGPLWFLADPVWSPPLGWWPWAAVAVAGAALVGLAAALAPRPAAGGAVAASGRGG